MELIKKKHIKTMVEADTYQEAILKAGSLLENDGLITDKYIQAMIDVVEKLGPYMVIMPDFALVHSAPSDEVKVSSMSLINLKNRVDFGNNAYVKVILCLACIDKISHLDSLKQIAEKLMIDGMLKKLIDCNNDDELYNLINF